MGWWMISFPGISQTRRINHAWEPLTLQPSQDSVGLIPNRMWVRHHIMFTSPGSQLSMPLLNGPGRRVNHLSVLRLSINFLSILTHLLQLTSKVENLWGDRWSNGFKKEPGHSLCILLLLLLLVLSLFLLGSVLSEHNEMRGVERWLLAGLYLEFLPSQEPPTLAASSKVIIHMSMVYVQRHARHPVSGPMNPMPDIF